MASLRVAGVHCAALISRSSAKPPASKSARVPHVSKLILVISIGLFATPCPAQRSGVGDASAPIDNAARLLASANAGDASLNGIAVVSPDRLCAVGNHGTILVSDNAGRTWRQVSSSVIANLHAVRFQDSERGLAVGGSIGNYSGTSRGTILRTVDGGSSWEKIETDLPRLRGLQFDGGRLLAWGDYCTNRRTGVFQSVDGGANWHAVRLPLGHVVAAAMPTSHATNQAPSGAAGSVLATDMLGRTRLQPALNQLPVDSRLDGTSIHCLHHAGSQWLAGGEQGRLLRSSQGRQWSEVELPISSEAVRLCRWKWISQTGADLWLGGYPGSIVLHSSDRGQTWHKQRTGSSLPLHDAAFLDARRGWAVGALGVILATRDGGQNWYPQRNGQRRLGVLAVTADSQTVPWSLLSAAAWDNQVSVAATVLKLHSDPGATADFLPSQAMQLQSIAPQLGIQLQSWRRGPEVLDLGAGHAGAGDPSARDAAQPTLAELASLLMTWRPNVLLTDDGDRSTGSGADLSAQLIAAIELCAAAQGQLWQELDLAPWQVDKLATVTDREHAQYSEQSQRVLRTLGLAIWDLLLPLPPRQRQAVLRTDALTQWSRAQNKASSTSLLGGVPPSSNSRRELTVSDIGNYQLVMGRVHRHKSLSQLANHDGNLERWRADLDFLISTLPNREVQPLLWQLTQELQTQGDHARQRLVLERMVDGQPRHDGAVWASMQWLMLTGSDEVAAWQQAGAARQPAKPISTAQRSANPAQRSANPVQRSSDPAQRSLDPAQDRRPELENGPWNATPFGSQVVPAAAVQLVPKSPAPSVDAASWFQQFDQFVQRAPVRLSRPDLNFLADRMARRQQSQVFDNSPRLQGVVEMSAVLGWPQAAWQEQQIAMNQIEGLPRVAVASYTLQRPQLDGQLDETCWSVAPPLELDAAPSNRPATQIHWAYDARYLYVAIRCPREATMSATPVRRIRKYDSDLSQLDHVVLGLDTDRDYVSTIALGVGEDGSTFDRCCGQPAYNPKWHVCVEPGSTHWTAEVAIELRHLTLETNLVGGAWGLSVTRSLPDGQPLSWSRSSDGRPQSAGLLLFLPREN